MIDVLTLTLALTLSAAPENPGPVVAGAPAPVQCADATLAPATGTLFASIGGPIAPASCSEDCDSLPDVSCSGTTCSAVSRNCSVGQIGYVECDGDYTYCADPCPGPQCEDNDTRFFHTGICCTCPDRGKLILFQTCQGGQWITTYSECGAPLTCPAC